MTDLNLDRLEELERAAVDGPWRVRGHEIISDADLGTVQAPWVADIDGPHEDAAFIVAMRNAAPALLARVRELEATVTRLEAQCASIGVISPGSFALPAERPDDSEANEAIAEAGNFHEAVWEIGEKYGVPVTNNMERWQDGVYLRHAGEFISDMQTVAEKFLVAPVLARAERSEATVQKAKLLVNDMTDPDPCWFDHHGGCQAHGYLSLKPGELCPHAEAKQWLALEAIGGDDA